MIGPRALRPCAVLRVREDFSISHPSHAELRGLSHFAIKITFFFKTATEINSWNCVAQLFAVIGGSAAIRHRFMRTSFFVRNPFEGPGWTGGPAPAPFLLRISCADLAPKALSVRLGFLTKHIKTL